MEYKCLRCHGPREPRKKLCDACVPLALEEQKQKSRERATAYRLANLEKVRAIDRKRAAEERAKNPEEVRLRKLKSSKNNLEYFPKYYEAHKDELRKVTSEWKKANPGRVKVNNQKRRAAKKEAAGSVTYAQWEAVCKKQKGKCYDCGRADVKLTMGHGVPLYAGGSHDVSNIIAQCQRCNCKQGKRIHPEFLEKQ
jgi:5-methylcytosine-specific restriction endonuclease McrA